MSEWLQVSLPALCPQGATWVEILRRWWEPVCGVWVHQPLPISQFPPSSVTFSSLPDSRAAIFLKFLREGNNPVRFSCLQTRIPAVMPGQMMHHGLPNAPSAFQHRSFLNSALLLSPFLHQSFSFLTQLLGFGDQLGTVNVHPPFCLLPLLSLQSWHFMKCMDVGSFSWGYGSTHSLISFYQRKRQNFCTDKDQKKSWILSAVSRNLLCQDHKSIK